MIIAIDGPSGAGKSTLGKMIARRYGLLYLDTGAMYRAVGLAVRRSGVRLDDAAKISKIAETSNIRLIGDVDSTTVLLDGDDVTNEIRTPEAAQTASIVSGISEVRRIMVHHQRSIGESSRTGCVLEGRDIGTVVFPDADVKFFLTATAEARSLRRFTEDAAKGRETSYETTLAEIIERDRRDATRKDSPLVEAADAIRIDTSELDLDEVFSKMCSVIDAHGDRQQNV